MKIHRIPTDVLLDSLRNAHSETILQPEEKAQQALTHLKTQVGHTSYQEIEDDISIVADSYEKRGFMLGFKLCFRILEDLTTEDISV